MVYKYFISPRNNFEKSEPPKKTKTDTDLITKDSLELEEYITTIEEINCLIADLKAKQNQLKQSWKTKKNDQQNKKDRKYILDKIKHKKELASILSKIKYEQERLDNINNPLPTNIDEANNRVLQETQAENVRRVNLSMSILPEKTIRFFKGIAKKLNNRGVSYSATITNNGHNTMLGSWNNYRDAVLTLDHTKKLQENNGVLFYKTIDQDDYYSAQMEKRLTKKGGKRTMPTFLPVNKKKKNEQIQKDIDTAEKKKDQGKKCNNQKTKIPTI